MFYPVRTEPFLHISQLCLALLKELSAPFLHFTYIPPSTWTALGLSYQVQGTLEALSYLSSVCWLTTPSFLKQVLVFWFSSSFIAYFFFPVQSAVSCSERSWASSYTFPRNNFIYFHDFKYCCMRTTPKFISLSQIFPLNLFCVSSCSLDIPRRCHKASQS